MQDVQVLVPHTYDGKWRDVGDVYTASNQDAKVLTLIGRVKEYVKPAPKAKAQPAPKAKAQPKATYTRRDMRADKA